MQRSYAGLPAGSNVARRSEARFRMLSSCMQRSGEPRERAVAPRDGTRRPGGPALWAFGAGCLAILVACAAPTDTEPEPPRERVLAPPAATTPVVIDQYPAQCWFDRTLYLSQYADSTLQRIAACPVASFQLRLLLSAEAVEPIRRIRELNPDIVLLGGLSVLSIPDHWNVPSARERFPLAGRMYDILSRHRALTVTGEPAWMWPSEAMVNPWTPQGVNETLLMDFMDAIAMEARKYPGVVDGMFHDYLSPAPYHYTGGAGGDPYVVDLDRDGINAHDDPNELTIWVAWQRRLLEEFQIRFGTGFVQVANGRLPHTDPQIASRVAGIAYESFPGMVWGFSDRVGFELSTEHLQPGWMTPRRGRLWSLLWDSRGTRADFCRIASMLTGQFFCLTDLQGPIQLDQTIPRTAPLAEAQRVDLPEGATLYHRPFASGSAVINFQSGGSAQLVQFQPN